MLVSRHLIHQPHEEDCHGVCEDDGSHNNSNIDGRAAATEDGRAHRRRYDALLLADVGVWVPTSSYVAFFGRECGQITNYNKCGQCLHALDLDLIDKDLLNLSYGHKHTHSLSH